MTVCCRLVAAYLAACVAWIGVALPPAHAGPFGEGWKLNGALSRISFTSIKKTRVAETHGFATMSGGIDSDGVALITVPLDSIDTGIDLRNVRMRFLLFETFNFPEATISALVDPAALAALPEKRRVVAPIVAVLGLHGAQQTIETEATVTMITDDRVAVASTAPIAITLEAFGLEEGVLKLEDAASVDIVPSAFVTFDMVFDANGATTEAPAAATVEAAPEETAVETAGDFSADECVGRFEILSRTGGIFFKSGSAELDIESAPVLATAIEIGQRCPMLNIVVEGHTDAAGSASFNQLLSEARANSVANYLAANGLGTDRVSAVGFGETRPIAPNDTPRNQSLNRRIEFVAATN